MYKLVLTVQETAEALGRSDDLVYELTAQGALPSTHLGRLRVTATPHNAPRRSTPPARRAGRPRCRRRARYDGRVGLGVLLANLPCPALDEPLGDHELADLPVDGRPPQRPPPRPSGYLLRR